MRFGGHETFHVRDGWLHKALNLLSRDHHAYSSDKAADLLGVGGNMAKAIRHWMIATGLATRPGLVSEAGGDGNYSVSRLGTIILEHDPYLTDRNTWWALHINLVSNPEHAMSWHWFFNRFGHRRFEKAVCVENLRRFLQNQASQRPPADRTLDRDVSVLLNTYARTIPEMPTDPEDSKDCPFQELGLLHHFRESGFYRLNFEDKALPPELLGYALTRPLDCEEGASVQLSTSALDAANGTCSPGRVFCMRPEAIFDLALKAEQELPEGWVRVTGLAGSRQISFRAWSSEDWLEHYYHCEAEKESLWLEEQKGELLKPR